MIDILNNVNFAPFVLSFKLASVTTIVLFVFTMPFAWYLSQTKSRIKPVLEALTALPIILPPSVLGFYLIVLLSQNSPLGIFLQTYFDISLLFSFNGLVVASFIYSLPFMVQPLQAGFESIDKNLLEASYLCGKKKFKTIIKVVLPNIKPAIVTAIVITFAHTVGEFGVVLMVGGSIPHETKVASVAIYEMVEVMDYQNAHIYSAILLTLSFLVLVFV